MFKLSLTFKSISCGVALGMIIGLAGCSPSVPSRLSAPPIPIDTKPKDTRYDSMIFVDAFADARPTEAIVEYKEKKVPHIEDLGPIVAEGLKGALQTFGFTFSDTAPIILSGQIRQWNAAVTGGMPSKVDANSELFVELLDPANKRMYSGVYKGYASVESPSLGEDEIKQALGASMKEAISQVTSDAQLLRLLSSY